MEKYFGQQCQDDTLNQKFREFHYKLVNEIISFCKENDIVIDEFHLDADGVKGSIPFGEWKPCTDSYFSLEKFTEDFKDVINFKKKVNNTEWEQIRFKQKPFIYSM